MEFNEIDSITHGEIEPTDITPSGKVNNNYYHAVELVEQHRLNLVNQATDYTGTPNEKNFSIYKMELAFSVKDQISHSRMKWNRPHVLSNLLGFPRMEKEEMYKIIKFEGFGVGSGARHDERNMSPSSDLALQIGGLVSINNNSDSPISNGDWIMWAIPEPGQTQKNQTYRHTERFLLRTEVFKPEIHEMSINSFMHWMKKKREEGTLDDITAAKPFEDINDHHELLYVTLLRGPDPTKLVENDEEQIELFTSLFKAIDLHNQKVHSRIIGQAKRQALPGGKFDLLCGKYRT